jgi:predicted transcriptional regulator
MAIRLPDDKHERLKELAKRRNMSVNKLIEELSTIAIAEFDAETRFERLSAKGRRENGLSLLDKLDSDLSNQL